MRASRLPGTLAGALALAAAALPGFAREGGASPAADDDPLLRRLDAQEERIRELERRLAESESRASGAPSPAAIDEAVARYLAEEGRGGEGDGAYLVGRVERPANDRFRFGVYTSVLYRAPDDAAEHGSFDAYRMVPQFSFDAAPGVEFATEIEFERGGADASFLEDNEILVEYAEVRFEVSEAFVARAGILLIPFLRYNLYHDDPIWNLQDRPFTATRIFRAALQQPGVGAEGVVPFGEGHSFNWNAALTNGPDDGVDNSGWGGARQGFKEDNNDDKTLWVRAGVAPRVPFLDAADLGASFATGKLNDSGTGSVRMTGFGFDGKVTKDRFDFIFEWTRFDYDRPSTQSAAAFPHGTEGAFFQLDTRLLRGLPATDSGLLGPSSELILAVRWEYADTNDRVTGAAREDDSRALTVGLALRLNPKTVIRVERKTERTSFREPAGTDHDQWVFSLSTYF